MQTHLSNCCLHITWNARMSRKIVKQSSIRGAKKFAFHDRSDWVWVVVKTEVRLTFCKLFFLRPNIPSCCVFVHVLKICMLSCGFACWMLICFVPFFVPLILCLAIGANLACVFPEFWFIFFPIFFARIQRLAHFVPYQLLFNSFHLLTLKNISLRTHWWNYLR